MTTLNATSAIKPGAIELLTGTDEARGQRPVLASHKWTIWSAPPLARRR